MCGACGTDRDWAASLLGGGYARTVVARVLTAAGRGSRLTVSAGPAGWMIAARGRPARLHRSLDDVLDLVAAGLRGMPGEAVDALLMGEAAHRPLTFDRRAVPRERRGAVDAPHMTAGSDYAIHRILSAAVRARLDSSASVSVELSDDEGAWALIFPAATIRLAEGA